MTDTTNGKISSAYRDLAIAFLVMQFIVTIVRSILREVYGSDYLPYLAVLFAPSMVLIFPLAIRVIIKLKASNFLIRAILAMFVTGILLRLIAVFLVEIPGDKLNLSLVSSFIIICILITMIYRMIINLFIENNHIIEKLWASVCVYFMIGAVFGTFYSILLLLNPGSMGIAMSHPIELYINGMIYSLNILSGFDPVFQQVSESFQMGAIMESTVATLFLVVLLGRLLGSSV